MTESEFIKSYMATWGVDETEDLINRGFIPVHTDHGWKFIYSSNPDSFVYRENLNVPARAG